nr:hypothetical protein [Crucivirus sp.]QKV51067.1 hypothetical protein [Crucivirus sp.]
MRCAHIDGFNPYGWYLALSCTTNIPCLASGLYLLAAALGAMPISRKNSCLLSPATLGGFMSASLASFCSPHMNIASAHSWNGSCPASCIRWPHRVPSRY